MLAGELALTKCFDQLPTKNGVRLFLARLHTRNSNSLIYEKCETLSSEIHKVFMISGRKIKRRMHKQHIDFENVVKNGIEK